jgi:hypothetical protein
MYAAQRFELGWWKKIHWQLAKLDKVQSLTIWGVLGALSCAAIFQVPLLFSTDGQFLDPGIFCSKNLELQHMSWLNIHCTGVYWHQFRTLFLNSSWKQSIIVSHMEQTVQVIVGMPFLAVYPTEYLSRAFNLGRVFIHFWYIHPYCSFWKQAN